MNIQEKKPSIYGTFEFLKKKLLWIYQQNEEFQIILYLSFPTIKK